MQNSNYKYMALAGLFAALTAVGAFIQVPLGFTSITLQTMITFLAGVILGPKWGAMSQIVYVVLGLAGLPVFTKGGGISYLLQPSMGFLFALILEAYVACAITNNSYGTKSWLPKMIAAAICAEAIAYAIGTPYMGAILNLHMGLGYSIQKIIMSGCIVYLPGDLVKVIVAILISKPVLKALKSAKLI